MKRIYITLLTLLTVLAFFLPTFAVEKPDLGGPLKFKMEVVPVRDPEVQRMIESGDYDSMRAIPILEVVNFKSNLL